MKSSKACSVRDSQMKSEYSLTLVSPAVQFTRLTWEKIHHLPRGARGKVEEFCFIEARAKEMSREASATYVKYLFGFSFR